MIIRDKSMISLAAVSLLVLVLCTLTIATVPSRSIVAAGGEMQKNGVQAIQVKDLVGEEAYSTYITSTVTAGRGGMQNSGLTGGWIGYRPTNGYVWEIRYSLDFRPDGSYTYTARQVSPKKSLWKIEHEGKFRILPSDSRRWAAILQLEPKEGSQAPPSEEDRTALVDVLGLPDNKPRRFRIKKSPLPDRFTLQLSDADPDDEIDRGWYLKRPGN